MNKTLAAIAFAFISLGLNAGIVQADEASGLPTGKRQHKPVSSIADGEGAEAGAQDYNSSRSNKTASSAAGGGSEMGEGAAPRDAASGLATGKRQHKPMGAPTGGASDDDADAAAVSPRDAASGLPTGKRQHKPMSGSGEGGGSNAAAAEAQDHNSSRSNKSN